MKYIKKHFKMLLILVFVGLLLSLSLLNKNISEKSNELAIQVFKLQDETISFWNIKFFRKLIGHFLPFSILGVLLLNLSYDNNLSNNKIYKRNYLFFVSGFLVAILSECIQILIPGRHFTIYDIIINSIGYLFGILVMFLFLKIFNKTNKTTK